MRGLALMPGKFWYQKLILLFQFLIVGGALKDSLTAQELLPLPLVEQTQVRLRPHHALRDRGQNLANRTRCVSAV